MAMLSRSRLHGGELLVVFVGAGTGNVAVVPGGDDFFLGPNIGIARPDTPDISSRFMELFFRSTRGKELLLATSKAVAAVPFHGRYSIDTDCNSSV
jgi:type I restriction enzyme, S subunit